MVNTNIQLYSVCIILSFIVNAVIVFLLNKIQEKYVGYMLILCLIFLRSGHTNTLISVNQIVCLIFIIVSIIMIRKNNNVIYD